MTARDDDDVATVVPVDDPNDPRLADYLHLTDAGHRRRGDTFLCEGVLVLGRAVEVGTRFRSVLVTPARWSAVEPLLAGLDVPVLAVPQEVMNDVTGFNLHRGVIALAERPPAPPLDDLLSGPTIAVAEGLNDAENLGALFRNAAAFGVDAVLLDPTCTDPLYRRTVRVSLGHVLGVPHGRIGSLDPVRQAGYTVVALTPDPSADPIETIAGLPRVALVVGAEGPGLEPATLAAADRRVRIPMAPGVDSLNVATAAAIAFHHRFRSP